VLLYCVGTADCVMALGFEKMEPGSLTLKVSVFVITIIVNHSSINLTCSHNV